MTKPLFDIGQGERSKLTRCWDVTNCRSSGLTGSGDAASCSVKRAMQVIFFAFAMTSDKLAQYFRIWFGPRHLVRGQG
jgi:hypothetical protein